MSGHSAENDAPWNLRDVISFEGALDVLRALRSYAAEVYADQETADLKLHEFLLVVLAEPTCITPPASTASDIEAS